VYLLNAPTEIEWVLGASPNTLLVSDLNLVIIDPLGTSTWVDTPIAPENFQAPTALVDGFAKYTITPQLEGFWRVRLVTGTADSYKILSKVEMQVFDNVTEIEPYSPEIGKPIPYDLQFYMQGYMVSAEDCGQIVINRDMVMKENDIRHRATCLVAPTVDVQVIQMKHNDIQFGTITFELNDRVAAVVNEYRLLLPGDVLTLTTAPGVIDYSIRDVAVVLTACSEVSSCGLL